MNGDFPVADVPVIHRGNLYVVFKNSLDPMDGVRKWHFNKALWVYYNKSRQPAANSIVRHNLAPIGT